jgi:hypothetical protein
MHRDPDLLSLSPDANPSHRCVVLDYYNTLSRPPATHEHTREHNSLIMIQTLLRRLNSIPVKTKFILWIRIRHLVEPVISPELPAFPHILYRSHTFLLHTLRNLRHLRPHSKDVLASNQCKLLFGCTTIQYSFQQMGKRRAVFQAGDDGRNTYIVALEALQNRDTNDAYHQSLIRDRRAPTRCGSQCRTDDLKACPWWLRTFGPRDARAQK